MARINLTQVAFIGNVSNPEGPTDVTTKSYVDARISTASNTQPTTTVSGALWVNTATQPYELKVYFNNLWWTVSGGVASTAPTINSGSLSGTLTSTSGTASPPVTFSVAGTNMTAGIVVTAPEHFEVSLASGGTYSSTITVTGTGTIAATTVYVRLADHAPVGTYNSQSIALTSAGATNANVTTASTGNSVSSSGGGTTITDGYIFGVGNLYTNLAGDYFSQPN